MNLYKCRRCKGAWAMETRVEKFWCPMCGNYVTDMSPYIEPDPQAGDGEIVKALSYALNHITLDAEKRGDWYAFARAIETLFRNHEGRLGELDTSTDERTSLVDLVHISSKENLEAACKIEDLERKVSDIPALWENDEQKGRKITGLERTVAMLEKRLKCKKVVELLQAEQPKPQPFPEQSRGVARCKDEKEEERVLRPGRSVVKDTTGSIFCFFEITDSCPDDITLQCLWSKNPDRIGNIETSRYAKNCTWLFDLDFPAGGDK